MLDPQHLTGLREVWQGLLHFTGGSGLWELRSVTLAILTGLSCLYWMRPGIAWRQGHRYIAVLLALRALGCTALAMYFGVGLLLEQERPLTLALAWANVANLLYWTPTLLLELRALGDRRLFAAGRARMGALRYARAVVRGGKEWT